MQHELDTDSQPLDVTAHEMCDARVAQTRDAVPVGRRETRRDPHPLRLDEGALDVEDRNVPNCKHQRAHQHQCAEYAQQCHQPGRRRIGTHQREQSQRRPAGPATRAAIENKRDERNQKREADAFQRRTREHVRERPPAFPTAGGREVAQERAYRWYEAACARNCLTSAHRCSIRILSRTSQRFIARVSPIGS